MQKQFGIIKLKIQAQRQPLASYGFGWWAFTYYGWVNKLAGKKQQIILGGGTGVANKAKQCNQIGRYG